MNSDSTTGTIQLFWTGGFDSTNRLLELVLEKKLPVQPHYLIDANRLSTGIELLTMMKIKQKLFLEFPFTRQLIRPTLFTDITDIPNNEMISTAYQTINKLKHLGTQYVWMARYCHNCNLNDMEISIEYLQNGPITLIIKDMIELFNNNGMSYYRIMKKFQETNEGILFKYYHFPILHLTKTQMYAIAKSKGWEDYIKLTWFCHKPKPGPKPCGVCHPCQLAIKSGLAFRIPLQNRIIGKILNELNNNPLYQKGKLFIKGRKNVGK